MRSSAQEHSQPKRRGEITGGARLASAFAKPTEQGKIVSTPRFYLRSIPRTCPFTHTRAQPGNPRPHHRPLLTTASRARRAPRVAYVEPYR